MITSIKKAKAGCGPVGFRGKQIPEVVEQVARVMREVRLLISKF